MNNKNIDSTLLSPVMSSSLTGSKVNKNASKALKIGEKFKFQNYEISLDKVEICGGSPIEKPKRGNEFVVATVSIKNGGNTFLHYSADMFKIKDKNGKLLNNSHHPDFYHGELDNGLLAGGGYDKGTITFERPTESDLNLCFEL